MTEGADVVQQPVGGVRSGRKGALLRRFKWPLTRTLIQLVLAASFLLCWQYLPQIHFLSDHFKFLDPFYISSPTQIWRSLLDITLGHTSSGITVWPYLAKTVYAATVGTTIGMIIGGLLGLIFSNGVRLSQVVSPFIVLANSVPRIALIPIFVVILGPTENASILSVIAVVLFLGFFNAFEGGRSIRPVVLEHARLLGAGPIQIMREIRLPRVLAWTFAAVPNAISFGLIVAVTTELLTGLRGMGTLLALTLQSLLIAQTFAIIVVLSAVGLALYGAAGLLRDLVIRWDVTE